MDHWEYNLNVKIAAVNEPPFSEQTQRGMQVVVLNVLVLFFSIENKKLERDPSNLKSNMNCSVLMFSQCTNDSGEKKSLSPIMKSPHQCGFLRTCETSRGYLLISGSSLRQQRAHL